MGSEMCIRDSHNGLVEQARTKDALTRHEEIIAIDDSYHANFSGIGEKQTEEATTSLEVLEVNCA